MSDKVILLWLSLIALLAVYLCGVATGTSARDASFRAEAVAAGHAEYYLDKDNNRQWRWKENK